MSSSNINTIFVPAVPILEIVRELTVGQRAVDTNKKLHDFLHNSIFPQLGPLHTEIYLPDNSEGGSFLPPSSNKQPPQTGVPTHLPQNHEIVSELASSRLVVEIQDERFSDSFLQATQNRSHLFVPIIDCHSLSGILYIGSEKQVQFSADFTSSLHTVAAIIGSRLRSLATIHELKESMLALEQSEQLRTALTEISKQAQSSSNLNSLYKRLHEIVNHIIHAPNFFIALVEVRDGKQFINFPYYADDKDPHFQHRELLLQNDSPTLTGYMLETKKPLLLSPDNFDTVCYHNNIDYRGSKPYSWLGVPFYLEHIRGAVAVQSYKDVVYSEKDKDLMVFVARHIGDALNRQKAVEELEIAKNRAELAEKNKSTFLANMSHEIRTPMNGILGLTNLILRSDISGQKRSYLEMVHASADRLLKLINDILDFSKIEAGKYELDIAPFSLRSTIASALEILAIQAARKNIDLKVVCEETIPDLLLGDSDRLAQILINLVENGIKFTEEGFVTVEVSHKNKSPETNGHVALYFQVRDTGIGIPKEKIPNVFRAFRQLGTTRDSNNRGTGLGLVIAAELVTMMGGQIRVDSKPGVGTCFNFSVTFPTQKDTSLQEQPCSISKKPEEVTGKGLNILLVEDEYINRTLGVAILENEGWQVSVAENGRQALDMYRSSDFDLILMDIQMPELNGYKTTKRIREMEANNSRHMPIIAMTAYAVKGDREKCLDAGMDGYISKPIHPEKIRQEITRVLQQQTVN